MRVCLLVSESGRCLRSTVCRTLFKCPFRLDRASVHAGLNDRRALGRHCLHGFNAH